MSSSVISRGTVQSLPAGTVLELGQLVNAQIAEAKSKKKKKEDKADDAADSDEDTALAGVRQVRPAVYVKGGDYDMAAILEGQAVLAYGGQAVALAFEHDRSTTKLLAKARREGAPE